MLMHTHQGCEAGMAQGGKPLEVMGMLLGYPSADQPKALVVTDVFPLPVTGFETSVVADDESVVNYMIKLSDMIEVTRKERLMGWRGAARDILDVDGSSLDCMLALDVGRDERTLETLDPGTTRTPSTWRSRTTTAS